MCEPENNNSDKSYSSGKKTEKKQNKTHQQDINATTREGKVWIQNSVDLRHTVDCVCVKKVLINNLLNKIKNLMRIFSCFK